MSLENTLKYTRCCSRHLSACTCDEQVFLRHTLRALLLGRKESDKHHMLCYQRSKTKQTSHKSHSRQCSRHSYCCQDCLDHRYDRHRCSCKNGHSLRHNLPRDSLRLYRPLDKLKLLGLLASMAISDLPRSKVHRSQPSQKQRVWCRNDCPKDWILWKIGDSKIKPLRSNQRYQCM